MAALTFSLDQSLESSAPERTGHSAWMRRLGMARSRGHSALYSCRATRVGHCLRTQLARKKRSASITPGLSAPKTRR